ncbi:Multidrug resistance protein MdtN [Planctomycetes bacterium Poly30]|uniref:Multidrug resistance protein MdtN n=1 Tax=Saltatorellus ferox TaxID=2528018 RepID=A0A518ES58_9BACT|nr:Multidrug resistance protein MdtN [Planctomycetes bacterium Poly30]
MPAEDLPIEGPGGSRGPSSPWRHGLFAAGLALAGALGARWIITSAPQPARTDDLVGPRAVPVETHLLKATQVPRMIFATGTLQAAREAVLASEVGGRVVFVAEGLRDGRTFAEGDVLLRVDTSSLEAEIAAQDTAIELSRARQAAAEADLEGAGRSLAALEERRDLLRAEEERWVGLAERGSTEQARVDLARNQRLAADAAASDAARGLETIRATIIAARLEIQLAENRQALLKVNRDKAAIRAPFPGRISSETAPTVGTMLVPMVPIGTWLDRTALRLVTDVHEDDLAALTTLSRALAAPLSRPGAILEGQITALGARVDPLTRSVRIEALFPVQTPFERRENTHLSFAPEIPSGTFARVELQGEPFREVVWVPESWLTYRDGQAVAFVVGPGEAEGGPVAELREVTFQSGTFDGGRVIESGLRPGDRIITSSLQLLAQDAALRLLDTEPGATERAVSADAKPGAGQ